MTTATSIDNVTTMTTMSDAELEAADGGALWVWFVGNLIYGILDSMVGDPPGCNGVRSCYDAGRG